MPYFYQRRKWAPDSAEPHWTELQIVSGSPCTDPILPGFVRDWRKNVIESLSSRTKPVLGQSPQ